VLAVLAALLVVGLHDPGSRARAERAAASQARTSLEQVLSYNYKTIDAQSARTGALLTGAFKGEFASAMEHEITPMAVKNQTVVQAKVSDLGVMRSSDRSVTVLAFVNQARIGADQKEPVIDQNRVLVTMTRVGERWLVSRVDAF
jgi:Mce-associated membrane protein